MAKCSFFTRQSPSRSETVDWIGDIHGHGEYLRSLLLSMGYSEARGYFFRPQTHTVFLGDMINRGPEIRETTQIVRSMCATGNATFLLGNHELYALRKAAAEKIQVSEHRLVKKKHLGYLRATHESFAGHETEWVDFLNWLFEQPFVFEREGIRGIHACWHSRSLELFPLKRLRLSDLTDRRSPRFLALHFLLEGVSLSHEQTAGSFRVRWWTRSVCKWKEFAYSHRRDLPAGRIPQGRLSVAVPYPACAVPLFFGHYGFSKSAKPIASNLACLDYGVATGGAIAAYRWQGEARLQEDRFFSFP